MYRIPDSGSDDMSSILIGCTKKVDVPDGVSIFFLCGCSGRNQGCLSVLSNLPMFIQNVEVFWKNIETFFDKHQKLVKTVVFC